MANILQVTPPGINTDNRVIGSSEMERQAASQGIHTPPDPSRVTGAQGQEGGKTGTATDEGAAGVIRSESNYGAFLRGLIESRDTPQVLKQMLLRFLGPSIQELGGELGNLSALLTMEDSAQAARFLKEQSGTEALFSGGFFDSLRRFLAEEGGRSAAGLAENFLKAYADYSAGPHLLRQMETLGEDIGRLLLSSFKGEWKELLSAMDWQAPRGMVEENARTINGRLIPFLASYISKTHDYGSVRNSVMLFIMQAVRYENGGLEHLRGTFGELFGLMQRRSGQPEDPAALFEELLRRGDALEKTGAGRLADGLAELISRGAQGQEGIDRAGQYQELLRGMLLNESVYMPLLHLVFPLRLMGKDTVSELWVDPDADKEEGEEGRKIKLFLKFDIQGLGSFELVMALRDRQAELHLYVPRQLEDRREDINAGVEAILKENGFKPQRVLVDRKVRDFSVDEIFPEIRRKENTVNVRI